MPECAKPWDRRCSRPAPPSYSNKVPLPDYDLQSDNGQRRGNLSEFAAGYVRELIIAGHLLPDEPLVIDELAEHLGVSVTPIREALLSLRVEGFVDLTRGKGFSVHPLSAADIEDVFSVHASVAGELAFRAASVITDEEFRSLLALHFEMQAAAVRGDLALLEEKNHLFHYVLNHVVEAPKLLWVLRLCTRYVPRHFYPSIEGWPAATQHDHGAIVDALSARDPEAARAAMTEHIVHSGELLAAHLRQVMSTRGGAPAGPRRD